MLEEDAVLRIAERFKTSPTPFTLTNMLKEDQPLIYANDAFCDLTGYEVDEIVGRNCRFLQGQRTDREIVKKIRKDLDTKARSYHCILNYRKDGETFHNMLMLEPIVNQGQVVFFAGCQFALNDQDSAALQRQMQLTDTLTDELMTASSASQVLKEEGFQLRTRSIMNLIQAYVIANRIEDLNPNTFKI